MSLNKRLEKLEIDDAPFLTYEFKNGADLISTELKMVVTCICPVLQIEDRLLLTVQYRPKACIYVETHSFYEWLLSFEKLPLGVEGMCHKVYTAINETIAPAHLSVEVKTSSLALEHRVCISTSKKHNFIK